MVRTSRRPVFGGAWAAAVALLITLAAVPAEAQAVKSFTFYGRGWGHGAGMSQWGAKGLAEAGWSYAKILGRFYRQSTVVSKAAPGEIRVGLLQDKASITLSGNSAFDLYDRTGKKRATGQSGETWTIKPKSGKLDVFRPGASTPTFTSGVPVTVRFESHATTVSLPQTGYKYKHGRIDFDINPATSKARAILIVPFEQYLYGLGEMPSNWSMEALKAQAVAARTYALEKITRLGQNRSGCNCGVYASTLDQAYVGTQHEVTRWVSAVDSTKALVSTYGGKPIQAFYSASDGGFSENVEYVFGGDPAPYLKGACDPGDYNGGANPNGNWEVTMDGKQIDDELSQGGYDVGPVQRIQYLSPRGVSGRVRSVIDADHGGVLVTGTLGKAHISGGTFRSLLGLRSTLILHTIYGGIRSRYDALNCAPGLPITQEFTWKDLDGSTSGRAQSFARGRLFWNAGTGKVFWTLGAILARYDAVRATKIDLGLPTTDEIDVAGGRASYFERGRIYWSSATAAHAVRGAILTKLLAEGGVTKWGFPTTEETAAGSGRTSRFQKARIYWTSKHGARIIYGAILQKYIELGGGSSRLGLPITDEYSITGGRRTDFEHGYITWNASTGKTSYKFT